MIPQSVWCHHSSHLLQSACGGALGACRHSNKRSTIQWWQNVTVYVGFHSLVLFTKQCLDGSMNVILRWLDTGYHQVYFMGLNQIFHYLQEICFLSLLHAIRRVIISLSSLVCVCVLLQVEMDLLQWLNDLELLQALGFLPLSATSCLKLKQRWGKKAESFWLQKIYEIMKLVVRNVLLDLFLNLETSIKPAA